MAIIILDSDRVKYTEFDLSILTDKKLIKTGSINTAVYSSGQVKLSIKATAVTSSANEHAYLRGLILGSDYYNNQFRVSIPPEFNTVTIGTSNTTTTITPAGSHTITLPVSDFIKVGAVLNLAGDDTLYTIVSKTNNELVLYPRLRKALPRGSRIEIVNPTILCNITNSKFDISSSPATQYYSQIALTFQEV